MHQRKFQHLIKTKPYLIDPYRIRNSAEVNEILSDATIPSAVELFDLAQMRSGLNASDWESLTGFNRHIYINHHNNNYKYKVKELFAVHRIIISTFIAIIIAISFLAFTPSGKAFAKSVYNAVVELIDDVLHIRSSNTQDIVSSSHNIDNTYSINTEFNTIDDAIDHVLEPIFYLNDKDIVVSSVNLVEDQIYGNYIETTYLAMDSTVIIINQELSSIQEDRIILADDKKMVSFTLSNGIEIIGSYSSDDYIFIGSIVSDTVVHISVNMTSPASDLSSYLSTLSIK